jgi:hypothetical protein
MSNNVVNKQGGHNTSNNNLQLPELWSKIKHLVNSNASDLNDKIHAVHTKTSENGKDLDNIKKVLNGMIDIDGAEMSNQKKIMEYMKNSYNIIKDIHSDMHKKITGGSHAHSHSDEHALNELNKNINNHFNKIEHKIEKLLHNDMSQSHTSHGCNNNTACHDLHKEICKLDKKYDEKFDKLDHKLDKILHKLCLYEPYIIKIDSISHKLCSIYNEIQWIKIKLTQIELEIQNCCNGGGGGGGSTLVKLTWNPTFIYTYYINTAIAYSLDNNIVFLYFDFILANVPDTIIYIDTILPMSTINSNLSSNAVFYESFETLADAQALTNSPESMSTYGRALIDNNLLKLQSPQLTPNVFYRIVGQVEYVI